VVAEDWRPHFPRSFQTGIKCVGIRREQKMLIVRAKKENKKYPDTSHVYMGKMVQKPPHVNLYILKDSLLTVDRTNPPYYRTSCRATKGITRHFSNKGRDYKKLVKKCCQESFEYGRY
jgi:hypothetical protein